MLDQLNQLNKIAQNGFKQGKTEEQVRQLIIQYLREQKEKYKELEV